MRKCSIIKLNYRQALKETNKYFVTINLQVFMTSEMIENVYQARMIQKAGVAGAVTELYCKMQLTFALRNTEMWSSDLEISN